MIRGRLADPKPMKNQWFCKENNDFWLAGRAGWLAGRAGRAGCLAAGSRFLYFGQASKVYEFLFKILVQNAFFRPGLCRGSWGGLAGSKILYFRQASKVYDFLFKRVVQNAFLRPGLCRVSWGGLAGSRILYFRQASKVYDFLFKRSVQNACFEAWAVQGVLGPD